MNQTASQTLLCAMTMWSMVDASGEPIVTFARGPRAVVRRMGFITKEINAAERALIREGMLERPRGKLHACLRLTRLGRVEAYTIRDLVDLGIYKMGETPAELEPPA